MSLMHGVIFNIQRFSIHDGPGIRTTVFFKGCNLRCLWCHNPESVRMQPEIQYYPEKCLQCGTCIAVCPAHAHQWEENLHLFIREDCQACSRCVSECFSDALVFSGRESSIAEVLAEIRKDRSYFDTSNGGVTFSGGEPLLQPDFLAELLQECRQEGFHCAVDTAGNVAWETFLRIMPWVDLFLFDLKSHDPEIHRRATGVENHRILKNLANLVQSGKRIWIRIPVVPGHNADREEITAMADFLQHLGGVERIDLLPYHRLGSEKYASLGRDYPAAGIPIPATGEMEAAHHIFTERNLPVHIMQ